MMQTLLLVDFENVQTIDVQHIPPDYRIASDFDILAKDTGYDPLVKHVHSLGVSCRRVATIGEIHGASVTPIVRAAQPSPNALSYHF